MTDLDILDAIDRATGCHYCEGSLGDSVSDLFCSEECQQAWAARGTTDAPVTLGMDPAGDIASAILAYRVEGQTHVHYIVLDETHVWRDEQLAAFVRAQHEAMRDRIGRILAGLSPAFVTLGEAWRAAAENIKAAHAALVEAGVVEKPLPVEPQARALALRKRRNTGPQQQQRAPRAINPRRAR